MEEGHNRTGVNKPLTHSCDTLPHKTVAEDGQPVEGGS